MPFRIIGKRARTESRSCSYSLITKLGNHAPRFRDYKESYLTVAGAHHRLHCYRMAVRIILICFSSSIQYPTRPKNLRVLELIFRQYTSSAAAAAAVAAV